MKIVIHLVVGVVLFAGALVGGLAATGRLNHEGTANIPLLGSLFPEPPKPAEGQSPAGAAADAVHRGGGEALDASAGGGQEPQGDEKPRKSKVGRSVVEPEQPPEAAGNGEAPAGEAGADSAAASPAAGHGEEPTAAPDAPPKGAAGHVDGGEHAAAKDFDALQEQLAGDRKSKYAPGGFFTFPGMPAGLTPEQINDAWNRVQGVLTDLDKRKQALDLREQDLQLLADDIDRRMRVIADQRLGLETKMRQLDDRIAKFQEQVKLVRTDEVAALKRNAQTLSAFEPSKAAELITEQWRTDKGQEEVLKTLEFMEKDKQNEIFQVLPNPLVQDLLKKRLRVSKEAAPSGPPGR